MSKYLIGGFIFVYLALISIIADSVLVSNTGGVAGTTPIGAVEGVTIGSILNTFWGLLSFDVGLPSIITIIFIYAPIIVLVLIILDYLVNLVPFT